MKKCYLPKLSLLVLFLFLTQQYISAQTCADIYVSPTGSGNGTISSPASLDAALSIIHSDTTRRTMYLLQGHHVASQTIKLPSHVKLFGGYRLSGSNWIKGDSTNQTTIEVFAIATYMPVRTYAGDSLLAAGMIGIMCDSVNDILINDITLTVYNYGFSYDGAGNGLTMYGVYARHSSDINLTNVNIITDKAGDGKPGDDGANGRNASGKQGGGQMLDAAHTTSSTDPQYKTATNSTDFRAGGRGGKEGRVQEFVACTGSPVCEFTPCVPELPKPAGDNGGTSGHDPHFPSLNVNGGVGGVCGDACKFDCYYDTYQQYISKPAIAGNIYNNGTVIPSQLNPSPFEGAPGSDGTGLLNGNSYTGQTQAQIGEEHDLYVPSSGFNGADGAGGGGGGGGGAGAIRVFALPPVGIEAPVIIAKLGLEDILNAAGVDVCGTEVLNCPGTGGAGGGGGEGGQGGRGGGGGGGNFGIYGCQNSSVATNNCTYQIGAPGIGGNGGVGGIGGIGSLGYAAQVVPISLENWNNTGADGGAGGKGGNGGDGMKGRTGEVYYTYGISQGGPMLSLNYKVGCTNSIIQTSMGVGNFLNYQWSGNNSDVHFSAGASPQQYNLYVSNTGTLTLIAAPTNDPFNQVQKTIQITQSRSLPAITATPTTMCETDSLNFSTTTSAQQYLWTVYDDSNVVVTTYRTRSGNFNPPVPDVNYTLTLQVFDDCCGWTTPVSYTFQKFKSFISPQISIPYNPTYCQGLDSTTISFSQYYDITWHRLWNTGDSGIYDTKVGAPGNYYVRFRFDNGCYSQWSDTVQPNILAAPDDIVQPMTFNDVCDQYPPEIVPQFVPTYGYDARSFSFYPAINAFSTLPGGNSVYEYYPQFRYLNGENSRTIYYGTVDVNTGCPSFNRAPIILNAETDPPYVYPPDYYKFAPTTSDCQAYVVYPTPITYDACSASGAALDSGIGPYHYLPQGHYVDKWKAADMRGNIAYFYINIDVKDEQGPLVLNPPFSQYLFTDSGLCGKAYQLPTVNVAENCGLADSAIWINNANGYFIEDSIMPVGVNTVHYSWTDVNGNATYYSYTVTITDDIPPTITCPHDTTFYLPSGTCTTTAMFNPPVYGDNCPNARLQLIAGLANGAPRSTGIVFENYRVYDSNDSASCFFLVTVKDTTAPVLTDSIKHIFVTTDTGKAYATLPNYIIPTGVDDCSNPVTITLVQGPGPGDTAGIGTHTIIWQGKDGAGNVSYLNIDLLVQDQQAPTVTCPAEITLQAQDGLCGAVVNYGTPVSLDNDGSHYPVYQVQGQASGSTFPLGVTKNYFRSDDNSGNAGFCLLQINVIDTVPPVFTNCPHDTSVYIGSNLCEVFLPMPTPVIVDAACPSSVMGFSVTGSLNDEGAHLGVARFDAGFHTLTYSAHDENGNIGTCVVHVNVMDTTTYTLNCEPGYTVNTDPGQCGATVIYHQPVLSPIISESGCVSFTVTGPGNGSLRPVGTTTDNYTYTVKNTILTCATTITVVDNQKARIQNCGKDTIVYAADGSCGATVRFQEPTIVDNCPSTASLILWTGNSSNGQFPMGTTHQLYYAYDNNNLTDSCAFAITVADTVNPVILPIPDVVVQSDQICGTTVYFNPPVGTDNSGCSQTTLISGKQPGSQFPVGYTREVYRVQDYAGNTDTCSFNVYVQPDTVMHVDCLSPPPTHSTDGLGAIVYYQTPGNFCEGTHTVFKSGLSSGAYYRVGNNIDEYLIIDRLGDTATCAITVNVFETNPPVITCGANVNITVSADSLVNCKAYVNVPPTVATDPSGVNLFYNEYNFTGNGSDYYPIGNTQVVWHAESQGFGAVCVQYVRVNAALTSTYDTIAYNQQFCSGHTVIINPGITIGDSVQVQWQKLAFNSIRTISTDKILELDSVSYFGDGGVYYLYLTSTPCVTQPQLVGLFQVQINQSPEAYISGLDSVYCSNDTVGRPITVEPDGGLLSGPGVINGIFYPNLAGPGTHTIFYVNDTTGISSDGSDNGHVSWYCDDTAKLVVHVNGLASQTPFVASAYCINSAIVNLDTTGSVYSGAGVSGFTFNPQVAGAGNHTLLRTVTAGGCTSSYIDTVNVSTNIPDATILTTGPFCNNLEPQLLQAVDTGGIWTADSNALGIDTFGRPVFTPKYATVGFVPVKYTVTRGACVSADSIGVQVKNSHYNVPYDLPEYCLHQAPVVFDTTDKRYIGPGFDGNVLHPDSFATGGIKFYVVVGINGIGCQDTVFRMYWIHGPDLPFNPAVGSCSGDSVQVNLQGGFTSHIWQDNNTTDSSRWLTTPGIYTVALQDTFGCAGVDTINFNYYPRPNTGITVNGLLLQANATVPHYQWYKNGTMLAGDTSGTVTTIGFGRYYAALTDSNGCITFSDTINYSAVCTTLTTTQQLTVCYGQSVTIGTNIHHQSGTYVDSLIALNGCDSVVTTTLTVSPAITSSHNQTICASDSVLFGNLVLKTPGTYYDTLQAINGCDSVITLQLTVLPVATATISQTICNGNSYLGHSTSGTFIDHYTAANGCDSARTLILTVLPNDTATINQTICYGDSFAGYNATGTYTDHYTSANGCDSMRTLNLTVLPVNNTTISQTICSGSSFDGYTSSGNYIDHYTGSNSCDSTRTLHLTVIPPINTIVNQAICTGSTFDGYNATGTYVDHFTSINGCDSIRTLNLVVATSINITVTQTICPDSNYEGHTTTGTYIDSFTAIGGCDSIRTLNLTVAPRIVTTVTQTICQGDSFAGHTTAGTYIDHYTSITGCDSARTLTLDVNPAVTSTVNQTICQDSSFGGHATTGTFVDHYTSATGCDSARTLNLTVIPHITSTVTQTVCNGVSFGGHSASGTYIDHFTSITGCDSSRTLNLTVLGVLSGNQTVTLCAGQSITVGQHTYTSNGVYTDTLQSVSGCDSVVQTTLTINNAVTSSMRDTICAGNVFAFGSQQLTAAGTYTDTVVASTGCDSVITLHLVVDPLPTPVISRSNDSLSTQHYRSYQWYLNGSIVSGATGQYLVVTQDGSYKVSVTGADGCGDTSSSYNVTGLGIEQFSDVAFKLYPNPNNGVFVLQHNYDGVLDVVITDAVGKQIALLKLVSQQQQFDLSVFAAGVYNLSVLRNHEKLSVIKVIKQ